MIRLLTVALIAIATAGAAAAPPRHLDKANVLPLALDDAFSFRKTQLFLNDPQFFKPTVSPMIAFERDRMNLGAVTEIDRRERRGNYFTFSWRAQKAADVTIRLEYRTERLGPYVQAREVRYANARGSMKTKFAITGDDYLEDGRVNAWRALLIVNNQIVGLTQSFLWN